MRRPLPVGSSKLVVAYKADDIRTAEAPLLASLPEGALMDRAAAGLALVCRDLLRERLGTVYGRRVVVLAGTGHNGGDALLGAALLQRSGVQSTAVIVNGGAHGRSIQMYRSASGRTVDVVDAESEREAVRALASADLVLDGIAGISGRPGLREPWTRLVEAIPFAAAVVAVDMPSGVDPDTGETADAYVRADVTVSFGAWKPCLLVPPAAHATGRVVSVSVGIEEYLPATPDVRRLTPAAVGQRWPVPGHAGHKYSRGVLGAVVGSDPYPGAAVLAVAGAVRAGVGIVRFIGGPLVTDHVLRAVPETVPGKGRVQAYLLGSGVEADPSQDEAIDEALATGLPCVVDAGALASCVRQRAAGVRPAPADAVLMTPHAGELARMLVMLGHQVVRAEVEARPAFWSRKLAAEVDAMVLLKGPTTLIAAPDGLLSSQSEGPAWLATAGSGDVLAGIAGALMATGVGAMDAGAMAACVHGLAARRASGGGPISAGEVATATPATIRELLQMDRV